MMKTIAIPTYFNIDLKFNLAGTGQRFGAYFIDLIIKWVYFWVIVQTSNIEILEGSALPVLVVYCPFLFYSFLFETFNNGQSPGKLLTKCRVIGIDGNYPTVHQAAIRWVFLLVDTWLLLLLIFVHNSFAVVAIFSPFLGFVLIITSKYQQRLGDMAARTVVISTKEKEVSINETIYAYAHTQKNYEPRYPEIMRLPDNDITLIQSIFEKENISAEYIERLANHIKNILKIESKDDDVAFLQQLLNDYNYYAINQ